MFWLLPFIFTFMVFCLPPVVVKATQTEKDILSEMLEVQRTSVYTGPELGELTLYLDKHGFVVEHNANLYCVDHHNLDSRAQSMNLSNIEKFQEYGYFHVIELAPGEFKIKTQSRGPGGDLLQEFIASDP